MREVTRQEVKATFDFRLGVQIISMIVVGCGTYFAAYYTLLGRVDLIDERLSVKVVEIARLERALERSQNKSAEYGDRLLRVEVQLLAINEKLDRLLQFQKTAR